MNYYPNYGMGQFYNPQMQQQMQRFQPMEQPQYTPQAVQPQPQPQAYKQTIGLQGKSVDSIDVVKAMDIPLDGTVSYFPLTDGSAIVSKQLQMDGTSKTVVYEPVKPEEKEKQVNNINEEFIDKLKQDNISLKEGMNSIKNQIQDISKNFDRLFEEMKSIKGGKR